MLSCIVFKARKDLSHVHFQCSKVLIAKMSYLQGFGSICDSSFLNTILDNLHLFINSSVHVVVCLVGGEMKVDVLK